MSSPNPGPTAPTPRSVTCPDGSWFKFDADIIEVDADHPLVKGTNTNTNNSNSNNNNSNSNNSNSNSNSNTNTNANTVIGSSDPSPEGNHNGNKKRIVTSSCFKASYVLADGTTTEAVKTQQDRSQDMTWLDCQEKFCRPLGANLATVTEHNSEWIHKTFEPLFPGRHYFMIGHYRG
jgi:hypothetical protein